MKRQDEQAEVVSRTRTRRRNRSVWIASAAMAAVLLAATPAAAAEDSGYMRGRHAHPLALLRYVLYPVGAALEYGVMRPLHLLASPLVPPESCLSEATRCTASQAKRQSYQDRRR